jgi:hypothetical protein
MRCGASCCGRVHSVLKCFSVSPCRIATDRRETPTPPWISSQVQVCFWIIGTKQSEEVEMPWKLNSHAGFKVTAFVADISGRLLAARHHISDQESFRLHHSRTPSKDTAIRSRCGHKPSCSVHQLTNPFVQTYHGRPTPEHHFWIERGQADSRGQRDHQQN